MVVRQVTVRERTREFAELLQAYREGRATRDGWMVTGFFMQGGGGGF